MFETGILSEHPGLLLWFLLLVFLLLGVDIFVLRRSARKPSLKSSVLWTFFWVSIALVFNLWIAWYLGRPAAATFLTAYLVEMSLSIDNLFVFILILTSMQIPSEHQHRLLFWGILGALVMRAICIFAGIAALQRFHWLQYVFAAILIFAGFKTFFESDQSADTSDPSQGRTAKILQRFLPFTSQSHGRNFFVTLDGKTYATPMLMALVLIELSDVVFAVDSIPAVLSISQDQFIVYSSNIFAILGLRNLYFVLAELVHLFRFLGHAISIILVFIGVKMGLSSWYHVPTTWTLAVICGLLFASIALSLFLGQKPEHT